jgi:hypothetical protein
MSAKVELHPEGGPMPTRELRNLTPPIAANSHDPRRWIAAGAELAHKCTFCGGPADAVTGCPDESGPVLWQVGVCNACIADTLMARFAAVKHQRIVALAKDMNAAADEIVKLRDHARLYQRDPAELRAEELQIREKFGLLEDTPLHDVTRRGSPLL